MRYVWHHSAWHPVGGKPPSCPPSVFPAIHSDHMDPLQHPVTGEMLDSKSAFRARTRAAGCVELGNDAPRTNPRPNIDRKALREDINTAISELERGRTAPASQSWGGMTRKYG